MDGFFLEAQRHAQRQAKVTVFLCKMELATYTKKRRFSLSAGANCVCPAWA